jgi:hypothetical protein
MTSLRDPQRRIILRDLGFAEEPFSRSADPRFLYNFKISPAWVR